jgi:hypothetical protein
MKIKPSTTFSGEDFWSVVLSQDRDKVTHALEVLDADSFQDIKSHLKRMKTENGWHPSQKASASFALCLIEDLETK